MLKVKIMTMCKCSCCSFLWWLRGQNIYYHFPLLLLSIAYMPFNSCLKFPVTPPDSFSVNPTLPNHFISLNLNNRFTFSFRCGWIMKKILFSSFWSLFSRQEGSWPLKPTHSSGISSALCGTWRSSLSAAQTFVSECVCDTSGVCIRWPGGVELAGDSKSEQHM